MKIRCPFTKEIVFARLNECQSDDYKKATSFLKCNFISTNIINQTNMKIAILLSLMLPVLTASAQVEIMTKATFKADPMTNMIGHITWTSRHVQIVEEENGNVYIELRNPAHIFSEWHSVKVGLYSQSGKLLEMSEKWHCDVSENEAKLWLHFGFTKDTTQTAYTDSIPSGTIKTREGTQYKLAKIEHYNRIMKAKDVLRFLKDTNGFIRITTPTYGSTLFDIKARIVRPKRKKN